MAISYNDIGKNELREKISRGGYKLGEDGSRRNLIDGNGEIKFESFFKDGWIRKDGTTDLMKDVPNNDDDILIALAYLAKI